MNRVGFLLLGIGTTLAIMGWWYGDPAYTGIGLAPLLVLYGLAVVFPEQIDYKHKLHSARMTRAMDWIWRGTAIAGAVIGTLAFWHSTASPEFSGIVVGLGAWGLAASIVIYTVVNDVRVLAWRQAKMAKRRDRSQPTGA